MGEDGAEFADQRAASLRRMFPNRQPPPVLAVPEVAPARPVSPVAAPTVRRRRWVPLTAVLGVAVVAAGVVVALRMVEARSAGPAVAGQVPEGFPVVVPPSFGSVSPAPSTSAALPSPSRPLSPSPVAGGKTSGAAPGHTGVTKATTTRNGPITRYSACSTDDAVTLVATFTETFSWHHVFIDADGDKATGYRIPEVAGGFGADYMVEDELLYRSTGAGWEWQEVAGVSPLASRAGGTFRWRLGPSYGGVRVTFNGTLGDTDVFTPPVRVKAC